MAVYWVAPHTRLYVKKDGTRHEAPVAGHWVEKPDTKADDEKKEDGS